MKAVSVIVPCYKLNKEYFARLMDSLLHQSIGRERMELILVNDGSPDDTLEELKRYEQQYPELIMVVDCPDNGGPGAARTIGISYATGSYVAFADQDDWVDLAMYELLYDKAQTYDCDAVKCDWSRDDTYVPADSRACCGQGKYGCGEEQPRQTGHTEGKLWEITDAAERQQFLENSQGGYWAAIYRRELLVEHHIFFPGKYAYDDNFFAGLIPFYYRRVYILPLSLYHWFWNCDSISMGQNLQYHGDRMTIELLLLEELKRRGLYEENRSYIDSMFFERYFLNTMHTIITRMGELPYELMQHMRKVLFTWMPDIRENPRLRSHKEYLYEPDWIARIISHTREACPARWQKAYDRIAHYSFMDILYDDMLTPEEWQLTEFAYYMLQQ